MNAQIRAALPESIKVSVGPLEVKPSAANVAVLGMHDHFSTMHFFPLAFVFIHVFSVELLHKSLAEELQPSQISWQCTKGIPRPPIPC